MSRLIRAAPPDGAVESKRNWTRTSRVTSRSVSLPVASKRPVPNDLIAGAGERSLGPARGLEKVAALQCSIAIGVAGTGTEQVDDDQQAGMREIGRVEPDRRFETLEASREFAACETGMKRQMAVRWIDRPGHRLRRRVLRCGSQLRGPSAAPRRLRGGACSRLWPGERQHAPEHAVLQHEVVVERRGNVHARQRDAASRRALRALPPALRAGHGFRRPVRGTGTSRRGSPDSSQPRTWPSRKSAGRGSAGRAGRGRPPRPCAATVRRWGPACRGS